MIAPGQRFDSATSLAARAGVHRSVVLRLLSTGDLVPFGYLSGLGGCEVAPIFTPDQVATVLQYQKPSRRYRSATNPTRLQP
jgi:hypothetical protein